MRNVTWLLWLLLLLIINNCIDALDYGTCDEPFILFKHTVATSDSARECQNYYNIFPDIHDEGATKFKSGYCAYQCKLELPFTCFKIHAPQTQFVQGLLDIDIFEKIITQKWEYALNNYNIIKYDVFFDYNMAFWVQSLDEYILHWQSNNDVKLEYFGIEWNLNDINIDDDNFKDNKFYSILIHVPQSSRIFEFISYIKPSLYNNIKWITDDIPRCTFKIMNNPYPWNREDAATIVPIRISQPTTNIDKVYSFYANILEAKLIHYTNGDQSDTKTIFMGLIQTHIEMQFIQRSSSISSVVSLFDDFTLDKYESLLMETHKTVITSPFCGQDRWMDNHYAYETYVIPGLLDKIYYNLNKYNIKYTVHKNTAEHVSDYIKHQLELVNYSGAYTFGLWVITPTGQSIKMGGVISDPNVAYYAGINDPNWCPKECNWGLFQGVVDPTHVYVYDEDIRHNNKKKKNNMYVDNTIISIPNHKSYTVYIVISILIIGLLYLIYHYLWYYVYEKHTESISVGDDYVPI